MLVSCDGIPIIGDSLELEELVSKLCKQYFTKLTKTDDVQAGQRINSYPSMVLSGSITVPDVCIDRKQFGVAFLAATIIVHYMT